MSATVVAYGGIGFLIRMNEDLVWPSATRESCEHPERVGTKFCPICGVKVETFDEEQGARGDFVDAFDDTKPDRRFMAETVFHDESNRTYSYGSNRDKKPDPPGNDLVFIGFGKSVSGSAQKVSTTLAPIPSEEELKAVLRDWEQEAHAKLVKDGLLPPTSIFDAPTDRYGLHVISYYS